MCTIPSTCNSQDHVATVAAAAAASSRDGGETSALADSSLAESGAASAPTVAAVTAAAVGLPCGLATRILVSRRAASVGGTSAKLQAWEALTVRDLLHGALLPSGNDAATALAEHFGRYCEPDSEAAWRPFERAPYYVTHDWSREDPLSCFVAEMNRAAEALG